MKKMLMGAAAFCCMMISMVAMSACSSSDDSSPAVQALNTVATVNVSADMLKYLDVKVEWYDEAGQLKSESLRNQEWTQTVKVNVGTAATRGMKVSLKLRDDVLLDPEAKMNVDYSFLFTYETYDEEGKPHTKMYDGMGSGSYNSEELEEWLAGTDSKFSCLVNYDTKGVATRSEWK